MAQTKAGALKTAAALRGMSPAEYEARCRAGEKWCSKGKHWTSADGFGTDKHRGDGRAASCRGCLRVKTPQRPPVPSFKGRRHTDEAKRMMSVAKLGRTPIHLLGRPRSPEERETIRAAIMLTQKFGAEHPNWRGGGSLKNLKARRTSAYLRWRRAVRDGAGGRCEACQEDRGPKRMHAHHVKAFALYPSLRLDPSNGMWLCDDCHGMVHGILDAHGMPKAA